MAGEFVNERRGVVLVICVAIILLPNLIVPGAADPWRFPKLLVVRGSALAVVLILAVSMIRSWRVASSRLRLPLSPLALVGWIAVATLVSGRPADSLWHLADVVFGMTLLLAAFYLAREGSLDWIWLLIVSTVAVNVVILFLQLGDIYHPLLPAEDRAAMTDLQMSAISRAGLMGSRNDLGMVLLFPFAWLLATPLRRGPAILGLGLFGAAILAASTVTAIIAAAVMGSIAALYRLRTARLRYRVTAFLLLGMGILILVTHTGRGRAIVSTVQKGEIESILGSRGIAFMAAAEMIRENPWFGVGPGLYDRCYLPTASELRLARGFSRDDARASEFVHNDYLETAAESGLPALLLGLWICWRIAARCKERLLADPDCHTALVGLLTLAGLVVCAAFLYPLQLGGVYGLAAIQLGTCWGATCRG